MNYEREEYMRRQEAEHNMIRMRDQRSITRGLDEKPFAYCCAEAGGRVEDCDCVRKDHGTALFKATCIIPNCQNRTPPNLIGTPTEQYVTLRLSDVQAMLAALA